MSPELAQAMHKILAKDADGSFRDAPVTDFLPVHSVVNYARAKKEAQGLKSVFRTMKGDAQSTFHELLLRYVPQLTREETTALFEAIDKDGLA